MALKYCDLVMKGGITSGLIYPRAVLELAKKYSFKNIGGTSAGAIAAVMTAAAELGERRKAALHRADREHEGFSGLKRVSDELVREGFIRSLFQAAPSARFLLNGLNWLMSGESKEAAIFFTLIAAAPLAALSGFAAALAMGIGIGWWFDVPMAGAIAVAAPGAIMAGLLAAVHWAPRKVARILNGNFFGLCSGIGKGALTDWMHDRLQRLSGVSGRPLVFADLWQAPRYKDEPATERSIDLVVFSSNVSHREPHSLPFRNKLFYFREDQFRRLFPRDVVDWMIDKSPVRHELAGTTYFRVPDAEDFPVVVAARMSLSFPLLLSAIPLHSGRYRTRPKANVEADPADEDALEPQEAGAPPERESDIPVAMEICWFSDGGLTLNFPIHLFDAPLPRWPTFAINLVYPGVAASAELKKPRMPKHNNEGWQSTYYPFIDPSSFGQTKSFILALISTVREWRDLMQTRAPGYRDRIVHVPLFGGEGGLNLDMPAKVLKEVSERGEESGKVILDTFKFETHYWTRYRNAMARLETFAVGLDKVARQEPPLDDYAASWAAMRNPTPIRAYKFNQPQIELSGYFLDRIGELVDARKDVSLTYRAPRPAGKLKIVPDI